jgi:hypothetical protein
MAESLHLLVEVYSWFSEGYDPPDLRDTRQLQAALNGEEKP